MNKKIKQEYQIAQRKLLANLKIRGGKFANNPRKIVDVVEALGIIHSTHKCNYPCVKCAELDTTLDLTFGKLIETIDAMVAQEASEISSVTTPPSQTRLERWALLVAVSKFYKNKNVPFETKVIENPATLKTIPEFAPDTKDIYTIWINQLADMAKKQKISLNKYDTNVERGVKQGGAFEKQLQRLREEFVRKMLTNQ